MTTDELGFTVANSPAPGALDWRVDPLITLTDLGRCDLDGDRRKLLAGAVYSTVGLGFPNHEWWGAMARQPTDTSLSGQRVGRGDVATVQELTVAFSRMDQRRGGGHGRKALVQYLHSDVRDFLHGRFPNARVRSAMFSAAAELSYLSGWMAFDNGEHAIGQQYFVLAVKLAAQADDPPLIGHILRAMAHQSLDLGFSQRGLELATASVQGDRYASATPRERALLGVIHARSLAATGRRQQATKALLLAEDDLATASDDIPEPNRTFFFGEAALAHETVCTLKDLGDHRGAMREFRHSARTRGAAFRRTHAVTLGYLGATQMVGGGVEEACATWSNLLESMEDGIYSGRARQAVVDMRRLLSPYKRRNIAAVAAVDARATAYLAQIH
ncbi:Tat pathway signal protein [Streptomyces sp. NPDC102274]|uniref:Tat pathway signal protein n=1 Tax=Streptomyces sp. NPDC102274 TaxID=3366151 RepID=UPI0038140B37